MQTHEMAWTRAVARSAIVAGLGVSLVMLQSAPAVGQRLCGVTPCSSGTVVGAGGAERLHPVSLASSYGVAGLVYSMDRLGRASADPRAPAPLQQPTRPRRGFILSLGAGFHHTNVDDANSGSAVEARTGVGTDLKIGYAPSNQFMLYYSNDAAFFTSESSEDLLATGLTGVGVTYYFKPWHPSLFLTGAVGISAFRNLSNSWADVIGGTGFSAGIGYEFARHFNVDLEIVLPRPRGEWEGDFNVRTVRAGLSWMLY